MCDCWKQNILFVIVLCISAFYTLSGIALMFGWIDIEMADFSMHSKYTFDTDILDIQEHCINELYQVQPMNVEFCNEFMNQSRILSKYHWYSERSE